MVYVEVFFVDSEVLMGEKARDEGKGITNRGGALSFPFLNLCLKSNIRGNATTILAQGNHKTYPANFRL